MNGDASRCWTVTRTHRAITTGGPRRLADNPGDIFHTNSLHLLDGRLADRLPAFAKNNLLLSMCHLDTILVVDPRGERVVWSLGGIFALQHDPTILGDGGLLLFDNNWRPGRSRVVAIDPLSGETVWEYLGSEQRPFYSRTCGAAAELSNGNILITESDNGRAFEITRSGEIVWEFYNPHRAGEREEYIATLFELQRLPPDFGREWLGAE
jgi:outer membrane protein assembly factor BamB